MVGETAGATQRSFEDLGPALIHVTFVVVDLETTGLSPASDRITEVGAVKVRAGEVLGEFHTLVHPGRRVPAAVTAVTGITDAMVRSSPPIEAVLPSLLEFLRDGVLVAHNAGFDVGFLDHELARSGRPRLTNTVVDTARLARRALGGEVRDCRLSTLARHLRSRFTPEHRALADARATVDVLHGLLERTGSLGVVTLEDLLDYCRSTSDPLFRKVDLVRSAPDAAGVYRFLDERGETLYVGKARNLRQRLRRYFGQDRRRRIADMVRLTARVEWDLAPTDLEAQVREVRAIQDERPRFNRRSRHPQRAVFVKLTRERFPRLSIVTQPRDDGAHYLGPVASRRTAEEFVEAVHEAIPLRQCTMRIRVAQDHGACVLKELGRCGAPCDGTQSVDDYGATVGRYVSALTGDVDALLGPLRTRMLQLARTGRFERAAGVRARLHTAATLLREARRLDSLARVPELLAACPSEEGWEIALIRQGRLVATEVAATLPHVDELRLRLGALPHPPPGPGPIGPDAVAELRLVRSWLDDGAVVLWSDGTYAEPVAGGAALAITRREARHVERAVRRDRQVLSGTKVARRGA
ncbi:MAG: DEDD exonuclease domain-containing protein [Actinobacteria bacterium]|nr:DEDD exonuclease domain-containing protein [Actinomycetota bacterium]